MTDLDRLAVLEDFELLDPEAGDGTALAIGDPGVRRMGYQIEHEVRRDADGDCEAENRAAKAEAKDQPGEDGDTEHGRDGVGVRHL